MTTVLVADDEPTITEFLRGLLEDEGYTVRTAFGPAVLTLAHEAQPALVLLDVNMPGMDGVEVARRLRTDPRTAHIPIVLMSTMGSLHARTDGLVVERILTKPFSLDTLLACVAELAGPPPARDG